MSFRAYSGPRGASPLTALEKDRALFKEFDTLDGALGWAHHLDERGLTALLIEGDDGTSMTKQEIVAALHHAENAPLRKSSAQQSPDE